MSKLGTSNWLIEPGCLSNGELKLKLGLSTDEYRFSVVALSQDGREISAPYFLSVDLSELRPFVSVRTNVNPRVPEMFNILPPFCERRSLISRYLCEPLEIVPLLPAPEHILQISPRMGREEDGEEDVVIEEVAVAQPIDWSIPDVKWAMFFGAPSILIGGFPLVVFSEAGVTVNTGITVHGTPLEHV